MSQQEIVLLVICISLFLIPILVVIAFYQALKDIAKAIRELRDGIVFNKK